MNLIQNIARQPLALAVALAFGAVSAQAATITVNDGGDAGTSTTCTLRQALVAANTDSATGNSCTAGSGVDTIVFAPALVNSTITLAQGQLQVESSLAIAGSGQTIDAGGASGVLEVYSNYPFALGGGPVTPSVSNLTLTGGSGGSGNAQAGGISTNCQGSGPPPTHSPSRRGTTGSAPSGTITSSSLTLSGVSVINNAGSSSAGGIYVCGMILNIDRSTVSGNTLVASGNYAAGGIYATSASGSPAVVTITNSTISGNSVSGDHSYLSGGLYLWDSSATLTNTTIAGNTASGQNDLAGGVLMSAPNTSYPVALNSCTVSGNSATTSNGSAALAGGALVGAYHSGILTLANSIVAGNAGVTQDILVQNPATGAAATAQFSLLGSALSATHAGNGNVFSDSPALGALANNGGLTNTMALQPGSPAIGAGSNALIPAAVTTDQRGAGFARIANITVDIGAFEVQPAAPAVVATPTPTLSTWAIALLVGLLGWFGLARKPQRD